MILQNSVVTAFLKFCLVPNYHFKVRESLMVCSHLAASWQKKRKVFGMVEVSFDSIFPLS